jgi:hypothetical protein
MVVQEYFGKLSFYAEFEINFGVCSTGLISEKYSDFKKL